MEKVQHNMSISRNPSSLCSNSQTCPCLRCNFKAPPRKTLCSICTILATSMERTLGSSNRSKVTNGAKCMCSNSKLCETLSSNKESQHSKSSVFARDESPDYNRKFLETYSSVQTRRSHTKKDQSGTISQHAWRQEMDSSKSKTSSWCCVKDSDSVEILSFSNVALSWTRDGQSYFPCISKLHRNARHEIYNSEITSGTISENAQGQKAYDGEKTI